MAGRRGSSDRSGGGYASKDTGVDDDVDAAPRKSAIRHRLPSGDVKRPPERLWMAEDMIVRANDPAGKQTRQAYGGIRGILETVISPARSASSKARSTGSSSEDEKTDSESSSSSGGSAGS